MRVQQIFREKVRQLYGINVCIVLLGLLGLMRRFGCLKIFIVHNLVLVERCGDSIIFKLIFDEIRRFSVGLFGFPLLLGWILVAILWISEWVPGAFMFFGGIIWTAIAFLVWLVSEFWLETCWFNCVAGKIVSHLSVTEIIIWICLISIK